ncbi:hypothetical protein CWM53_03170 [Klebsiella sp. A-Nf5]|nr:hypothetical protein CWM53_03170 [Klebsiella sp. A-Nf5]PJX37205.1 hypothetical protein CWM59_14050 [Klebsiella sp. B-Nf7]PJX48071.1 hypothetical protein CWM60_13480 [Klebsiella sp. C1-16S-Nf17]
MLAQRLPTRRQTTLGLKNAVLIAYLADKHVVITIARRVIATFSFPVFHSTVAATTARGRNSILRIANNKATSLQLNLYQPHKIDFRYFVYAIKNTMLTAIPEC